MTTPTLHTILYMDDEEGCARLVIKKLRSAGFEVDWVQDGEDGLARLTRQSYDLLVVDHRMPRKDGMEVVRALASGGSHPPIIMITGMGSEALAVEALKLGVKDYIVKDMEGQYINLLPTVLTQALKEQALIQDRDRAVQALKRSEERYRSLVEHSPDAIVVCREGLVIFANSAACRFLGAHYPEAVLGKPLTAFWPAAPSMDTLIKQTGERSAVPELPSPPVEDRLVRLDGDTLEVEVATVLLDGNSSLQIIARDISWRRQAEEQLRKANDALEQRVTARTRDLQKLNVQLQEKIIELEAFHDATVGREHKMMALKEEIDKLRKELALLRSES